MVVKFKIVPRQRHQHTELVNVGFSRNTISSQTRLLGVDFCDRLNTAGRRTAIDRVAAAELQAQKLCLVTSLPPRQSTCSGVLGLFPKLAGDASSELPR